MTLAVRPLGPLLLDPACHPRGQPHLSAASGLVRVRGRLYVIADDEHHLGVFDASGAAPGRLVRLFDGDLPLPKAQRKALKPDLEVLLALPAWPGSPHGALLALGSGSRPNRQAAVLMPLDAGGDLQGTIRHLDLQPLYQPLRAVLGDLNIEGAFIAADELVLLQRGNAGDASFNACIHMGWDDVLPWLQGDPSAAVPARAIRRMDLGTERGIAFGFTDGAALPGGGWVFSAVAEDTADSYRDGACAGVLLGTVGPDGTVRSRHAVPPCWKVEGVAAGIDGDALELLLVTDADDPDVPSQLLSARLPLPLAGTDAPRS
jgi:hypothetical protein